MDDGQHSAILCYLGLKKGRINHRARKWELELGGNEPFTILCENDGQGRFTKRDSGR